MVFFAAQRDQFGQNKEKKWNTRTFLESPLTFLPSQKGKGLKIQSTPKVQLPSQSTLASSTRNLQRKNSFHLSFAQKTRKNSIFYVPFPYREGWVGSWSRNYERKRLHSSSLPPKRRYKDSEMVFFAAQRDQFGQNKEKKWNTRTFLESPLTFLPSQKGKGLKIQSTPKVQLPSQSTLASSTRNLQRKNSFHLSFAQKTRKNSIFYVPSWTIISTLNVLVMWVCADRLGMKATTSKTVKRL